MSRARWRTCSRRPTCRRRSSRLSSRSSRPCGSGGSSRCARQRVSAPRSQPPTPLQPGARFASQPRRWPMSKRSHDLGDTTLVERFAAHVAAQPNALAYRFLLTGDATGDVEEWTYGELDRRVRAIAARLQETRAEGERALL